jgi:Predicted periplasmic protein (DUF2092)
VQQASTANPELDAQALAVLKWMAAFLTQAPRCRVTLDTGLVVVQDSGQKIAGGDTRQIVRRRPDVSALRGVGLVFASHDHMTPSGGQRNPPGLGRAPRSPAGL